MILADLGPRLAAWLSERCAIGTNGCWRWRGALSSRGHAIARIDGRVQLVHRHLYQLSHELPARLRGTCGTSGCVQPAHYEPVRARQQRALFQRSQGLTAREIALAQAVSIDTVHGWFTAANRRKTNGHQS